MRLVGRPPGIADRRCCNINTGGSPHSPVVEVAEQVAAGGDQAEQTAGRHTDGEEWIQPEPGRVNTKYMCRQMAR